MTESLFKSEIATRLKAERKRKGLSLDATAALTGVSKAMLGQIERQESSPTIATLWKIASGLETSFSAFFASKPKMHTGSHVFPNDENMAVNTLFPFSVDTGIEVFEVVLSHFHQQNSPPHGAGVIEHIHVIQGSMQVFFDDHWHNMETGDSLRFHCDQPHGYKAISETAVFQNIVSYPRLL